MTIFVPVDYNSWQESEKGLRLAASLDKDVVLAEGTEILQHIFCSRKMLICHIGYKEYKTGRKYLAKMGDWRNNKDVEVPLDGIGGVNILVKADVHRSGLPNMHKIHSCNDFLTSSRDQFPMLCIREPSRDRRLCKNGKTGRLPSGWITKLRCLAYRHSRKGRQLGWPTSLTTNEVRRETNPC